jgi:hypothetical protein
LILPNPTSNSAEYFARFNLGNDVPFVPYENVICNYTEASTDSRGAFRPNWELLYSHYGQILGMDVPWVKAYLDYSLPLYPGSPGYEGGLGSWGEGSGHYDSLGWGSLLHHLDNEDVAAAKSGSAGAASSSISISSVPTSSVDAIVPSSQKAFTSTSAYSHSTVTYSTSATFAAATVPTTLQTIPIYSTSPTTIQPRPTQAFKNLVIVYVYECTDEE